MEHIAFLRLQNLPISSKKLKKITTETISKSSGNSFFARFMSSHNFDRPLHFSRQRIVFIFL